MVSIWEGAPFRLQKYMDLRRFISITSAMRFTNKPSPSFLDRFHDVRQMINNFNEHYLERTILPPGSVSSMSRWTLFLKSSAQGSWVFHKNPTLLETSSIALQMEMRVILWCTGWKYNRGRTFRNMQMASGCSPQTLREKIWTRGGSTLRPSA